MRNKTTYILLTVFTSFAIFMAGKFNIVNAAKVDGKKFDNWIIKCQEIKDPKEATQKICSANQVFSTKIEEKDHNLAHILLSYSLDTKELVMIQTISYINQGMKIDSGTSVLVKQKMLAPGKFILCNKNNCMARSILKEDEIKSILNEESFNILFLEGSGKQMSFPVSTKGLKQALDYIKF